MRTIVEAHKPDFIAFQEVSQDAFQELQEIFRDYRIWPPFPTPAGTAILTNHDWVERGELKLSGNLARRLAFRRTMLMPGLS